MSKEELRIGNYVRLDGFIKIIGIRDNETLVIEGDRFIELVALKPIKLSANLIRNLGFKKKDDEFFLKKSRYNLLKTKSFNGYLFRDGVRVLVELNYVHELQNLYFALTNKELVLSMI